MPDREGQGATAPEAQAKERERSAYLRAENEDDDGYDPYSDFHDNGSSNAIFERDPWN